MSDNTVSFQRHLPDPEKCRTRYRGKALDISNCLMEDPDGCKYVANFGSSIICLHPGRRGFEKAGKPI
jgi:hypothetical protein